MWIALQAQIIEAQHLYYSSRLTWKARAVQLVNSSTEPSARRHSLQRITRQLIDIHTEIAISSIFISTSQSRANGRIPGHQFESPNAGGRRLGFVQRQGALQA